ncbi:MAG: hypothetical protein Q8S34_02085, partial [Hydrogenophaga sp.]|nr:hypothetical protein [Hydrogenophaga sp.]
NAALFDPMPLHRMAAAQQAVQAAALGLPDDLVKRLADADALSDDDRHRVTEAAREALACFLDQDGEGAEGDEGVENAEATANAEGPP